MKYTVNIVPNLSNEKMYISSYTAHEMKFSEFPADLVLFNEEILDGKLHFLCSAIRKSELVQVSFISRSHLC